MTAITTTAEAEKAIAQVADLIDKLRGVVEQETALVHAGKVRNAATLGPQKSELDRRAVRRRPRPEGEREVPPPSGAGERRRAAQHAGGV